MWFVSCFKILLLASRFLGLDDILHSLILLLWLILWTYFDHFSIFIFLFWLQFYTLPGSSTFGLLQTLWSLIILIWPVHNSFFIFFLKLSDEWVEIFQIDNIFPCYFVFVAYPAYLVHGSSIIISLTIEYFYFRCNWFWLFDGL